MIERVISGGQSGVDRAALDAAIAVGVAVGGWCPRHRWAEDGPIHPRYPLRETASDEPIQRTRWNVRDSDATLILAPGRRLDGGTALTQREAARLAKPCLVVDPAAAGAPAAILGWLAAVRPRILNVAGPRQSKAPGVYDQARTLLDDLLARLRHHAHAAENTEEDRRQ